ncbi:Nuclease-related domain-containing protein [Bhargavaea ginsengi]|uniref:Nuclease-related domain-containing protein n=1 Tax=Bhargavaea ginsengi TaxID=426757 RepID=A0A1H6UL23_9BACL|nr:nuclease-related domain-containing protein [Bhargavaea ginsengi]SEI93011.1 Nuclease-related domain-containing protein [Bhargavaea ginsengi]
MKVTRKYPIYLHALERAMERLKEGAPEREQVREELLRQEAGYFGEIASDKYVRRSRLPGVVLTDIQIEVEPGEVVQIDTLILTRRGIWLIESKKYKGALQYQLSPRRIERRERGGSIIVFPCPIIQLESQIHALEGWLEKRDIKLPVFGTVAFASHNVWEGLPDDAPIIPTREIPLYLETGYRQLPEQLSMESFDELMVLLDQERHYLQWIPICKKFSINPNHLKRGFLCLDCSGTLTRESERTLHCKACDKKSKADYGQLILDWFLLVHPTLNNAQLRAFAKIKRKQTASRILRRYELAQSGKSIGTTYTVNLYTELDGLEIRKRG